MRTNRDDWQKKINELKDVVRRHVRREEDKMFPRRAKNLTKAALRNLGGKSWRSNRRRGNNRRPSLWASAAETVVVRHPSSRPTLLAEARLRVGLSPAVKVLDLKGRLRCRGCRGKGGRWSRSVGGGRARQRP